MTVAGRDLTDDNPRRDPVVTRRTHMARSGPIAMAVAVAMVTIGVGAAWAQRDLAKELVGTWEGTQQQLGTTRGGETPVRERILVVRSVRRSGDGWTVDCSFGLPGQKLTRFRSPASRLQETGDKAVLTLTYPSGTYVTLSLDGKDWLSGHHQGVGAGTRDRALSLKRVSTEPRKE
jgi:hypothetical protein